MRKTEVIIDSPQGSAFNGQRLVVVRQDADNVYVQTPAVASDAGMLTLAFALSEVAFVYECDVPADPFTGDRCGEAAVAVVIGDDEGRCAEHIVPSFKAVRMHRLTNLP